MLKLPVLAMFSDRLETQNLTVRLGVGDMLCLPAI
jgi:hypothetical protein